MVSVGFLHHGHLLGRAALSIVAGYRHATVHSRPARGALEINQPLRTIIHETAAVSGDLDL